MTSDVATVPKLPWGNASCRGNHSSILDGVYGASVHRATTVLAPFCLPEWPLSSLPPTPFVTERRGPRTACAALLAGTWPTTSQPDSLQMQARCVLDSSGAFARGLKLTDLTGYMHGLHVRDA